VLPIRRITSDFRELRWGHVLVELVLLIVGILIALAVNGWIEDRRDALTERQYLEGIVRDLDRDLTVLKEFADFHQSQVADGVMAYRALRTEPDVKDKEGVAQAVTRLMSRRTLRLSHPTYSNLVGTGNARLIRNAELRDRIVGLYEANERWAAIIDRNNLVFVDQIFAEYVLGNGLVAPRPTNSLASSQKDVERLAGLMGVPVGVQNDRLWGLAPDSSERGVLTNKIWYRSLTSLAATTQANDVAQGVTTVRNAILDELARRWPDARPAPAAN
jgi:hypothetical protein